METTIMGYNLHHVQTLGLLQLRRNVRMRSAMSAREPGGSLRLMLE